MPVPTTAQRLPLAPDYDELVDAALDEYRRAVSDELLILAECQRLEALEPLHVGGRWYPPRARQFARKSLAAKNVRGAARLRLERRLVDAAKARGARHCVWCQEPVLEGQACEALAGKLIHVGVCGQEFNRWTSTYPLQKEG